MKKHLRRLLCLLCTVMLLAACGQDPKPTNTDTGSVTVQGGENDSVADTTEETTPAPPPVVALDPSAWTADMTYDNGHGSLLSAYFSKTADDYAGVCAYYEAEGWSIYCENEWNGNTFATFTKGSALAHVYWLDVLDELNIVTDAEGAVNLPPQDEAATGTLPTQVVQLQQQSSETSGMAYVVRLSDGSFIIYDGGYDNTVDQLLTTLKELDEDGDIHIRAWLITHSHDDHFSCFKALSSKADKYCTRHKISLKLDYVLIAPVFDEQALAMDADGAFFASEVEAAVAAFEGAKLCYVHTGMTLNFCNLTMEILYTPEDLFIDGSTGYFNDTSIVSRLSSNQTDTTETLSMIFLGDAGASVAARLMLYYGEFLRSDMCQISHHGVEDFPLVAYQLIGASRLFYPCNQYLYDLTDRDAHVRAALRASAVTEEILIREVEKYTRFFDPSLNPASVGKPSE